MDVVAAVSGYMSRMVSVGESSTAGSSSSKMKILLLDSETVGNTAYRLLEFALTVMTGSDRFDGDYPVGAPKS